MNGQKTVSSNSQSLQATNILDNIWTKFVILEGKLSSAEMQIAAGKNYENLQSVYNIVFFLLIFKLLVNDKKCLLDLNDKLH